MRYKYILVVFVLAACGFAILAGILASGQNHEVERTSPDGVYRVKIEVREETGTGTRDRNERLKIQYFKQGAIIHTYESVNSDQYEPSMRKGFQVVEWLANNVLRMGEERLNRPFNDEIVVTNAANENLRYVEISYGRFESLHIFDLPPRGHISLLASPGFKQDGSSRYFLGYGGMSQSGKEFSGALESKPRKTPADGPLKFQITITTNDFR